MNHQEASGLPLPYRRSSLSTALSSPIRELIQTPRGERRHVAAVCFRVRDGRIDFLLVRTRAGKWTFPKGGVDGDPTSAAAAAREAWEEAGVRGSVENDHFVRYRYPKRGNLKEIAIDAHLCHVWKRRDPRESRRHPTWFPAERAKRRLREGRAWLYAEELARVVDAAVVRIARQY